MTGERVENGWVTEDGYLCDGCAVREGHMHRCHGDDGGRRCTCEDCWPICQRCKQQMRPGDDFAEWMDLHWAFDPDRGQS